MPDRSEYPEQETHAHDIRGTLVISPWSSRDMMQITGEWIQAETPVEVRR